MGNYPGTYTGQQSDNLAYSTGAGLMVQMVEEIKANTEYTLSVDVGSSISWYGLAAGAGIEIAEFTAGGLFVADLSYAGFGGPNPITDMGPGTITRVTITYTTGDIVTPGNMVVVVLGNNPAPLSGYGTVWDNADFTSVSVPEPTTVALLTIGSIAGLIRRRKNM